MVDGGVWLYWRIAVTRRVSMWRLWRSRNNVATRFSVRYVSFFANRITDPSLVDLPPTVSPQCRVFRNVITSEDEQKLWEELQPVLEKAGTKAYAPGGKATSRQDAAVRNVAVDLFGFEEFTDVRDVRGQSTQRRLPGLVWSPSLVKIAKTIGAELLGDVPDTVRVLEHHMPGYEMHVETPPLGVSFACMHLFAPGVVTFDNEAAGETGCCLLPNRAVMHCTGELRWGWRVGERFDPWMDFPKQRKRFAAEYRIGLWFFKFTPSLGDRRAMQDKIDESLASHAAAVESRVAAKQRDKDVVVAVPNSSQYVDPVDSEKAQMERERLEVERRERAAAEKAEEEAFAREALEGVGLLGGELPREQATAKKKFKQPKDAAAGHDKFEAYRDDFARVSKIIEKVRTRHESGGGVDEIWMKQELSAAMSSSKTRNAPDGTDDLGFNPANPTGAWDDIAECATHYKQKLKAMDFDAQPTEESLRQSANKMMGARDDLLGDLQVDPFDPREAARILQKNREELKRRK